MSRDVNEGNSQHGFVNYFDEKEQETEGVISAKSRNICAAAELGPPGVRPRRLYA